MKSSVSLHDIARRARVSHVTVSNVLNRHGFEHKVSPSKATRIRALALQMGYVPHHAARSLKLGKTSTIALVTSWGLRYPHVHELVEQIRAELSVHRYHLSLELAYQASDEENVELAFLSGRYDGVIRFGLEDWAKEKISVVRRRGMPVVVFGPVRDRRTDSVDYDRLKAARLAAEHLVQSGHRNIAAVVGPGEYLDNSLRMQGYRQALRQAGLDLNSSLIFPCAVEGDPKELWRQVLSGAVRPTAVLCYNDELAAVLLHAIRSSGFRVPEDVAVVAADNTWVGRLAEIPLTCVDTNREEIARALVGLLLERMNHPLAAPKRVLIEPHLVVRASSGGDRTHDPSGNGGHARSNGKVETNTNHPGEK